MTTKRMTEEELETAHGPRGAKWDCVYVDDANGDEQLIAIKKPNRATVHAFNDLREKDQHAAATTMLVNGILLTHSPVELSILLDEHPTLDSILAEKAAKLVVQGVRDAKKKPQQ